MKEPTTATLDRWWSKAVLATYGSQCVDPECNQPAGGCHHVNKRRYLITRWEFINGLPLCQKHHMKADQDRNYALSLKTEQAREYLEDIHFVSLKENLPTDQSVAEYKIAQLRFLKEICGASHG